MWSTRVPKAIVEFGAVVPRAVGALAHSDDWSALSARGARQLGEVVGDELVLTGMTLMGPTPQLQRPLSDYQAAADELSALGIDRAHAEPEPLCVKTIDHRRIGRLTYERLKFAHDPRLPPSLAVEGLGGPATAVAYVCRHGGAPRPWLVWVHGAGQGQPMDLLVSRASRWYELGFNVALPVQPGHGPRHREWPTYPDLDPLTNVAGMMRAVSEVRALVRWLQPQATATVVAGLSLGSPVAALVSQLEKRVDAVAVYTPILGLNAMMARHLGRWGPAAQQVGEQLKSDVVSALTSVIDPLATEPAPPPHRRLIVGAWHDRMALREPALALHERWGGELHWHDGSHVGHLFSRRVQAESEKFFLALGDAAP